MTVPSSRAARFAAPFVLVAALALTGCAPATAPTAPAISEAPEATAVGTGITSLDDVRFGSIDSADPEFNAAIEALVLVLNAASPGGLDEININAHDPSRVGINLLTDSTDGTVTSEQLTAVLTALATFRPPTPVTEYIIGGFTVTFGTGDVLLAGADAGVNPEFIDEQDARIEIPGDQLAAIFN